MAFQLVKEDFLNQDYRGHAESCTYTFTVELPDQIGARWTANQHMQAHIDELANQGSVLLEYRLWEDKSPTFHTDYKCEIVASASPLFWMIVVVAVLAIIALLVTNLVIQGVKDIFKYAGPGLGIGLGALGIAALVFVGVLLFRGRKSEPEKSGAG